MKTRWKVIGVVVAVAGLLAVGLGYRWYVERRTPSIPIASSGGVGMELLLSSPKFYSQNDPRWDKETIGGSSEKIANVGCTLCSVAMAITGLGSEMTPKELNAALKEHGGYTDEGWLIWDAVSDANPAVKVSVASQMDHPLLDGALRDGAYPIVKFWLPSGVPHWVVIIGKEGQEYLVLDPLQDASAVPLSSRTQKIEAIRLVRKS